MNVNLENPTVVGKERDLRSRIVVVSVKRVLSNLDRFLGLGHRDIRNHDKRVLGSYRSVGGVGGIGGVRGIGGVGSRGGHDGGGDNDGDDDNDKRSKRE
jgi:hypothetical protein